MRSAGAGGRGAAPPPTEGRPDDHGPARRGGGAQAVHRPPAEARVLRRPGRDPVPRRSDRRDRGVPPARQRERRRALRDVPPYDRPRRARAGEGRVVPRLHGGRGGVRAEHDVAQLPAHPRARARAAPRRRGAGDEARPRRERGAVARPAGGHRDRRADGRRHRRPRARPGRPGGADRRPDAGGGLPDRRQLGRHGAGRPAHRRAGPCRRRARVGRRRPLRAARADRRGVLGHRRPRLLALQVLRPAHGARVRQEGAARLVASLQGEARRRRARGAPVRAGHQPARAPRGLRRRRRLRALDRLGGDRGTRADARRALPGRAPRPDHAARPPDDGRPCADLLLHRAGPHARGGRDPSRRGEIAVWWGNYYALETMRHLGLDEHQGAVRAGIVHTNTTDEIDRLLAGLEELL